MAHSVGLSEERKNGRTPLPPEAASAFAPGAITNFFSVHYNPGQGGDLRQAGATGGGYVLPKGVTTKARIEDDGQQGKLKITVDGDANYPARTTRKAIELLFTERNWPTGTLALDQTMEIPVGCGFGASAAAAISAVYATAAAVGLAMSRAELAFYAHAADIIEQTGLGTVSVTYDATGAGAITRAGAPGAASFLNVRFPTETRIVTASLGPYRKSDALSSPEMVRRICELGDSSLARVQASPDLKTLAAEGERFSHALGLMTAGVEELVRVAKRSGAAFASQNMIGHAIHAIATEARAETVAAALNDTSPSPAVEVFRIGSRNAETWNSPAD